MYLLSPSLQSPLAIKKIRDRVNIPDVSPCGQRRVLELSWNLGTSVGNSDLPFFSIFLHWSTTFVQACYYLHMTRFEKISCAMYIRPVHYKMANISSTLIFNSAIRYELWFSTVFSSVARVKAFSEGTCLTRASHLTSLNLKPLISKKKLTFFYLMSLGHWDAAVSRVNTLCKALCAFPCTCAVASFLIFQCRMGLWKELVFAVRLGSDPSATFISCWALISPSGKWRF